MILFVVLHGFLTISSLPRDAFSHPLSSSFAFPSFLKERMSYIQLVKALSHCVFLNGTAILSTVTEFLSIERLNCFEGLMRAKSSGEWLLLPLHKVIFITLK